MGNDSNRQILKALQIADELMEFADEAGNAQEAGYDILSGLMRDCAYRIRRQAESEGRRVKKNLVHANAVVVIVTIALLSVFFASPADATTIILSTDNTETLGGLTFGNNDLAQYNPSTDTATLYFDGDLFTGTAYIDATHVLGNGNIILSTFESTTLGGLSFDAGDLVEYNPSTDKATLFFDQDLFSQAENIDAAHILGGGNIILSTIDAATLGGLSFGEGDLVEYNPSTDTATLYLDGSLFSGSENIDAVHVLASGNIIISTSDSATLGGLTFGPADLAEYNPLTDTATLYFDENNFTSAANIDGIHLILPEPATIALLGLGSLALVGRKRR
jgi:hypothetical protein